MKKLLFALSLVPALFSYAADGDTMLVQSHDHVDMNWYGNYDRVAYFPTTGKTYNKVYMNFTLGCASGGCSHWDYDVHINVMKPTGQLDSNIIGYDTISYSPLELDTNWNVYEVEETFEMARVITPYGTYMDLGTFGYDNNWEHRHLFDVTDFVNLFQDSVKIRSFFSGWSSGFDVTLDFYFIEGTPARDVLSIQNIFQGGAGYPDAATFNVVYTPSKNLTIPAAAEQVSVRVIPTGHGFDNSVNCAEFCPKDYFVKVDGGYIVSNTIWDDQCGMNPVFPQGGTWIYNRANWCPGTAARVFEDDITPFIVPGNSYDFDFDVEDFTWTGTQTPSYSITAQLVSFGDYNFEIDAELSDIITPSDHEEHGRYNPSCANPEVEIKNNGRWPLNTVDIKYWVNGSDPCWFTWTGDLAFGETERVILPLYDWYGMDTSNRVFHAEIVYPTDDWSYNNKKSQSFDMPPIFPARLEMWFKTNLYPEENTYYLLDENHDTLYQFTGTAPNTYYKDTFDLLPGCYSLQVTDIYGDGMNDFPVGQGDGLIQLRKFIGSSTFFFKTLERDFGQRLITNFMVGYDMGSGPDFPACEMPDHTALPFTELPSEYVQLYPNPASDEVSIEVALPKGHDLNFVVRDANGKQLLERNYDRISNAKLKLDVSALAPGFYTVTIQSMGMQSVQKLLINR